MELFSAARRRRLPYRHGKEFARYIAVAFSQTGVEGEFTQPLLLPQLDKGYAGKAGQCFDFGNTVYCADAVRLTILDNWHDSQGGDRVGLSEVEFFAPEPSPLLLIATGLFGFVCFVFFTRWRRVIMAGRRVANS